MKLVCIQRKRLRHQEESVVMIWTVQKQMELNYYVPKFYPDRFGKFLSGNHIGSGLYFVLFLGLFSLFRPSFTIWTRFRILSLLLIFF